jgi:hypothetical protein
MLSMTHLTRSLSKLNYKTYFSMNDTYLFLKRIKKQVCTYLSDNFSVEERNNHE